MPQLDIERYTNAICHKLACDQSCHLTMRSKLLGKGREGEDEGTHAFQLNACVEESVMLSLQSMTALVTDADTAQACLTKSQGTICSRKEI